MTGIWKVGSNQPFLWSTPHYLRLDLSSMLDPITKLHQSSRTLDSIRAPELMRLLHIDKPRSAVVAP